MKRILLLVIIILICGTAVACRARARSVTPTPTSAPVPTATAPVPTPEPTATPTESVPDMPERLARLETFSTVRTAIETAGLSDMLRSEGPLTLFAPTDAAFAALPPGALTDPDVARQVLRYHLIGAALTTDDWTTRQSVAPLLGDAFPLTIVHGADAITDTAPVTGTGAGAGLDTFRVNDATIITANIAAANGVIHGIDAVLIPPGVDLAPGRATVPAANADLPDLIDTAAQRGDLTTLLAGLDAAGLTETLRGAGPFTLFAPTDTAFGTLVEDASADLLQQLDTEPAPFLLYHMVPRYISSFDLYDGLTLDTMQGEALSFTVPSGDDTRSIQIESSNPLSATITTADIQAGNGIIHVIDAVLLPPPAPAESP